MNEIFKLWKQSETASQIALDTVNRVSYPSLGIVTNNEDPEGRRRIKVALPSNPNLESDWLIRISSHPFIDAPLPPIGQTVIIFYIDGLETKGAYLHIINDTNPALDKGDPVKDLFESIPGDKDTQIQGSLNTQIEGTLNTQIQQTEDRRIEDNLTVDCGSRITLQTDSGASILLTEFGEVIVTDSVGRSIRLGGGVDNLNQFNLNGHSIDISNASDLTINGTSVVVVGADTSDGATVINKGY
ncbi:hypothetical protein [Picosynechococcus sp. PCC 7117]|uniref:hypothetical protein n=1 Tax=Picosynechococcus sp. PCC 7117 TaxID=195498 RepID=UPI0008105323|nr:hypothetical protein [Picosynechococcus sp. PCC 7117]ANV88501.1 hypothetical protein AWQ22_14095 [Picosynechococcus sp. PCC 7117]